MDLIASVKKISDIVGMNVTNLKADINFLCGATSATYSDADKMRNVNVAYQDVARMIWESDSTYSWDDSNNTTGPVAYRTIANASASYVIPTTALRIRGVEVKDSSGQWLKLKPVSLFDLGVSPENYMTGVSTPIQYMVEGNEIRLFPAPGTGYVTMSSGMAVRLSRAVTELATSATTTEPGFPTNFHRILSLAASVDFTQDENQRNFLLKQKDRLEKGLANFYSHRAVEYKTRITPVGKKRWRQYQ